MSYHLNKQLLYARRGVSQTTRVCRFQLVLITVVHWIGPVSIFSNIECITWSFRRNVCH